MAAAVIDYYDAYGTLPRPEDIIFQPTEETTDHTPTVVPDARAPLTAKQLETLQAAVDHGYYEVPRETKLKDLADEFDCSHQALSERLRRTHGTLATAVLAQGEDSDPMVWTGSSNQDAEWYHLHPHCPQLTGSANRVVQTNQDRIRWHDLDPCPRCAATRPVAVSLRTDAVPGGAD